ncbi:MAG TPA: VCBS repeat-containing protein, partial [Planctomycetota bacterium]|nr:VCBS repeat-containing protein [Planctomycetota bacterium]
MNHRFRHRALVLALLVAPGPILSAELSFTDITLEAGTGGPEARGRTGGHGVAFADVDQDGLPDLHITMIFNAPMPDLFYLNRGRGRFADAATDRGLADPDGGSHGATFADFDGDGDYDLLNGTTLPGEGASASNNIYRNNGKGFFEDATPAALRARSFPTRAALAFDLDGDGDLDIVTVTGYLGTDDPKDERNEVYRNDGDLRFTAIDGGDLETAPLGQGAVDTDFDGDGDIDLLAANRTGDLNVLRNDG